MDTLARARKLARQVNSQNRKMLRKHMNEYDVLARAARGSGVLDRQSPDTIADISQSLQDNLSLTRNTRHASRRTQVDIRLTDVVSQDVKDVWQAKIGLASHLDSDVKVKLRDSVRNQTTNVEPEETRDMRLTLLARSFVQRWLYTEGYNPVLHSKE